jgi:tetratricopeptide (TPR) repeat protein
VLGNVAELEFADGHPEQALRSLNEALEIDVRGKNASYIANDYANGAAYRLTLGDLAGARESAREGLRVARQARVELFIAIALQHLALLAGLGGDGRRAAQSLGYVNARFTELGYKRAFTEQCCYDKLLVALRETLHEDELAPLLAEGATWSEERVVEEVLQV